MVVARTAIDKFLAYPPMAVPAFKHADPRSIDRTIFDSTGRRLQSPKTQPRPYQLEGLAFALWLRCALLFFDMRMGKSYIALQWAEHLRYCNIFRKKGLIIAHSPLGLQVWEREIEKHSNLKATIVHLDPADLIRALDDNTDLIVIPPSGLQELFTIAGTNPKTGKGKLFVNHQLIAELAEEFDLCVIDEIHMYGDKDSLRFQIAAGLTEHCTMRLGLTGTPFGRDPFKLWAQAFLIDRGKTLSYNYYFFEQAFGIGKKNWFSKRLEYKMDSKKLPVLEDKMSVLSMSYKRTEVADQTVWASKVELHMTGDQLVAYRNVVNKLIKLRGEEDAVEILSTFLRLRQVSSGYLPFDDSVGKRRVVHFTSNPKLEWLKELVAAEPEIQVIIFYEFTHTGEMICDVLKKHKVMYSWMYGATSLHDSNLMVQEFQAGRIQYLVTNSAKGGMSLDLPQADYIVYFESPVSVITRQQSEARPMARGERPLMIDDLVCSPVEHRILEFYQEGKDLSRALSGVRVRRSLI